jgi:hypothetical protein
MMDDDNDQQHVESQFDCLFNSCIADPKGSVHRAWSLTLLLSVIFFIIAIVEGKEIYVSYMLILSFIINII